MEAVKPCLASLTLLLALVLGGCSATATKSPPVAAVPHDPASDAKQANSDRDKGIDKNLEAALIQQGLRKGLTYDVKNGVVTMTGEVSSESERVKIQAVIADVPNVQQVVNKLRVKD
jgi:hypothetical protein